MIPVLQCQLLKLCQAIEIATLDFVSLEQLARRTKLIITTVGPYAAYGEAMFEVCAKTGTHYLDCTGESPWVLKMIRKYHDIAKANGAIMIPECGIESAPPDLSAFSLVSFLREKIQTGTKEVILSVHDMKGKASGGTIASALDLIDYFSLKELGEAMGKPWKFSPIEGPITKSPDSALFGRTVENLGFLTPHIAGGADRAIVYRSWGLLGGASAYGPKFSFNEYIRVNSKLRGFLFRMIFGFGLITIMIKPIR
jgi:Saccharopine dehydrogenase NADP binding domain